MIEYVTGDLFKSGADCIVNTVNSVGIMGKGIALQFKHHYPEYFLAYKEACRNGLVKPGVPTFKKDSATRGQMICSFPTKLHWRNPSQVEWIESGLRILAEAAVSMNLNIVGMSRPGCGNGGLDWNTQVKHLAEKYLEPGTCKFLIY